MGDMGWLAAIREQELCLVQRILDGLKDSGPGFSLYLPERFPVCITREWHIIGLPLIVCFIAPNTLFDDLISKVGTIINRKAQHRIAGKQFGVTVSRFHLPVMLRDGYFCN